MAGNNWADYKIDASENRECTLIKAANPSAFVVVSAARGPVCFHSHRHQQQRTESVCNVDFVIHHQPERRRPPPRACSPCTFRYIYMYDARWQLLREYVLHARRFNPRSLGTHRHSIIIHQRTRECLSQQTASPAAVASLQNENATQASARQEPQQQRRAQSQIYMYTVERELELELERGAPFCLHRTAHPAHRAASHYRLYALIWYCCSSTTLSLRRGHPAKSTNNFLWLFKIFNYSNWETK
jgi:hypothetical protein